MSFLVQHIRSGEFARRPLPLDLAPGQLAVNYNNDSTGLFFRTDSGELVKAGPVHVGSNAPPQTNYTERSIGEMWLDTTDPVSPSMRIYTQAGWSVVNVLAGSITEDKIAFGAVTAQKITLNNSLFPTEDKQFDLGSTSKRFKHIYTDNITISGDLSGDFNFLGTISGDLLPDVDNIRNIGSPSRRWANIYTGDLHLKNDKGDWTLIEDKEFLTLRNNESGKRFKIVMEAID
jgi:hypothetical protein